MAKQYYYFVTGLPNIGFEDSKVVYSPDSFMLEAEQKLNSHDIKLLKLMYLPQDLENLLALLFHSEKTPAPDSTISTEQWQELIAYLKPNPDNETRIKPTLYKALPSFIPELTRELLSIEEASFSDWESRYLKAFYTYVLAFNNKFVSAWFDYNRNIQNILIALAGRKYDYPFADYLIGNDEVVEKLTRSQAADFGLGKQFPLFDALYRIYEQHNMIDRERNYDALRWRWIDNQNFFEYFNIDRILGYFCKLRILNRWISLDPDYGKEVFFDTLNTLENSFVLPEVFDLKQKVKQ